MVKKVSFCSCYTIHEFATVDGSGLQEEDDEGGTHEDVAVVEAECQVLAVGRPHEGTHEGRRVLEAKWHDDTLARLAVPTVHEVAQSHGNVAGAAPV